MARSCRLSSHVSVVVAAIFYVYFSTVLVFIDRWLGLGSSPGMMNAAVYTLLAVMCVSSYYRAIYTDPGRVPSSFMPDVEDAERPIHEIKRKGGDLRYCQKRLRYKPPRAHHCRVCNRCVLRMVISGLILLPLCLALGFFLGWHSHLILQNKTTIEYYEGVRAMWLAEKGGHLYSHPYDNGAYENLRTVSALLCLLPAAYTVRLQHPVTGSVGSLDFLHLLRILGPKVFCWLCPISGHIGSGLYFRTKYDNLMGFPTPGQG